ncbi:hypothetical protein GCM10010129_21280 [Streptomyces fumigatiscleroticus]|nr:hypothetical protein GCM10010129_21280 [Streptomyces fumigatiscleroticus]
MFGTPGAGPRGAVAPVYAVATVASAFAAFGCAWAPDRAALSQPAVTLGRMAVNTSPETPLPVGEVSRLIGRWIDRLGAVWVEGQITQLSRRPGAGVVFLTLRDPSYDISVSVTCYRQVFDAVADVVSEGARVVVHAKPECTPRAGSCRCGPPRYGRWGSGSCWPGWNS